ncbi:MAG: hypothetical protein P4L84_10020 [Isosphaeraceae bacterium]|nr:hypothetical protein [Isosphaeraceae bacterium]
MATKKLGTAPKPSVFVLMPFDKQYDDIYKLGIKAAATAAGAYCERVDEQEYEGTILDRIYNQIRTADVVVADLTERNPNVFYETGYAHALGKRTILLTQDASFIPFDLKHHLHIVYGGQIATLKERLKKRIKSLLETPEQRPHSDASVLVPHFEGEEIATNKIITVNIDDYNFQLGWNFHVGLHNPTSRTIEVGNTEHSLVFPKSLGTPLYRNDTSYTKIARELYMCSFQPSFGREVLPDGWITRSVELIGPGLVSPGVIREDRESRMRRVNKINRLAIRRYTLDGMTEMPFTVLIE